MDKFDFKSEYFKIQEPDIDLLSDLILSIMGDKNISQFALECNVDRSTLSRVINKKIKRSCKLDFLIAISNNPNNNSSVTLDELLEANGFVSYMPEIVSYTQQFTNAEHFNPNKLDSLKRLKAYQIKLENFNNEPSVENEVMQIVLSKLKRNGYNVNLHKPKKKVTSLFNFMISSPELNFDDISQWLFISKVGRILQKNNPINNLFAELYLCPKYYKNKMISIILCDKKAFETTVNTYKDYKITHSISIIYVNTHNKKIEDEFIFSSSSSSVSILN